MFFSDNWLMLNLCLQLLWFQRPDPPAGCDDVVAKRAEFQRFAKPCVLSTDVHAVRPLWRYFTLYARNAGASTDTEAGCCQAPWCHQRHCYVTKTRSRQFSTAPVINCSSSFSYSGTASICNLSVIPCPLLWWYGSLVSNDYYLFDLYIPFLYSRWTSEQWWLSRG